VHISPSTIIPGSHGGLRLAQVVFSGPSRVPPQFAVWRTDQGKPREVAAFTGHRGRHSATWDGFVAGGPAPEGSYAISVTVEDTAGNRGSAPAVLPPVRAFAVKRDGVDVAYFSLTGSLVPVRPGGIARLTVGPVGQRTRWRLAPWGRGGAVARGTSSGSRIAVRVPRDAQADVYSLLATSAGGRRAAWPLVVANRGGAAPALVVVPAITWQGQNGVDSSGDGFPDTLDAGDAVPLARPFARGRPPRSIADAVAALVFLGDIRANFDLTTDVALAAGHSPTLAGHRGILFAGSERWVTPALAVALRRFVVAGGKVASFGADAFRRRVTFGHGMLSGPTAPQTANAFGERTSEFTSPAAPMVTVGLDKLGLFAGTDGFFGSFTRFERSDRFGTGIELLAGAGRGQKPDFVAYRLGRGTVVRVGSDQWAANLAGSAEVRDITRRLWALLSQ
jgi:hypothetical protein